MPTRQDWRTVPSVFARLDRAFGPFTTDVAASAENALCEKFITEEQNALSSMTAWRGPWFANIPFGRPLQWVTKAALECLAGQNGVLLCNAGVSAEWFHYALKYADLYIPDRRIQYWHPGESPWGYDKTGKLISRNYDRDSVIFHFNSSPGAVHSFHVDPHHEEVRSLWRRANGLAADWLPPRHAKSTAREQQAEAVQ